jgi:protein phosphatase
VSCSASAPLDVRPVHALALHPQLVVVAHGGSDVGKVRRENEDNYAALAHLGLFVVADGMGGAAAGEVASRITVKEVQRAVDDGETTWPDDSTVVSPESGARRMLAGLHRANRTIRLRGELDPDKRGMGTTFAGLLLLKRCALVAHVGDSRVYRLRDGELTQLTQDHSLVNLLVAHGLLAHEEAATSRQRHVITRAVGVHETLEVETKIIDLRAGDTFLVCSDGLHGEVPRELIEAILKREKDPRRAVEKLIAAANDMGGADNVTAIVARIEEA